MEQQKIKKEEEPIDKKQASVTGAIFGALIICGIIFGLMMHIIVVPMQNEMKGEIEGVRLNNSQFMETQKEMREIINENKKLQDKINKITLNLGEWNCTRYKKYFDYDCQKLTKEEKSVVVNNNLCVAYYGEVYPFDDRRISIPSLNYVNLPEVCEKWEYVR